MVQQMIGSPACVNAIEMAEQDRLERGRSEINPAGTVLSLVSASSEADTTLNSEADHRGITRDADRSMRLPGTARRLISPCGRLNPVVRVVSALSIVGLMSGSAYIAHRWQEDLSEHLDNLFWLAQQTAADGEGTARETSEMLHRISDLVERLPDRLLIDLPNELALNTARIIEQGLVQMQLCNVSLAEQELVSSGGLPEGRRLNPSLPIDPPIAPPDNPIDEVSPSIDPITDPSIDPGGGGLAPTIDLDQIVEEALVQQLEPLKAQLIQDAMNAACITADGALDDNASVLGQLGEEALQDIYTLVKNITQDQIDVLEQRYGLLKLDLEKIARQLPNTQAHIDDLGDRFRDAGGSLEAVRRIVLKALQVSAPISAAAMVGLVATLLVYAIGLAMRK